MSDSAATYSTIFVASDHAGFALKKWIKEQRPDLPWEDLGCHSEDRVDYPDYADKIARALKSEDQIGLLICGTGEGMAMRANRYPNIRAAVCCNTEVAKLSREHNNANILCLGGRVIEQKVALAILDQFLTTAFAGGRHTGRVEKLSAPIT